MSKMKELLDWAEARGMADVPTEQLHKLRRKERAMLAMSKAQLDHDNQRKAMKETP
jgi:hypothetical protein